MNADRAVAVRDVYYAYPGGERANAGDGNAVDGVSLDVRAGDVHAVMGANGAGKTTLLRLVAGLRDPDAGTVEIAGEDPVVGFAPENPQTGFFEATVAEEVAFFPRNRGLDVSVRVEAALDAMDVADFREASPLALSGGEQRRVSIASVLAGDPTVLALDEPTSGLHARGERELGRVLAALDTTVVCTTHAADFAYEFADAVTVVADGRVVRTGPAREALAEIDAVEAAGIRPPGVVEWAAREGMARPPRSVEEAAEVFDR